MIRVLLPILTVASLALLKAQKFSPVWPPDDEVCKTLIRQTLGAGCRYLTYELFPLRSESDGLAILYTRDRDTLWILYQREPGIGEVLPLVSDLTAWYVSNRNAYPEKELLVEKNGIEACYRTTLYQLWGFTGASRYTRLWEATDRELERTCKGPLRTCTLLEESHSPQWMDLDGDGIPEWVDNIRLTHLKDPAKKTREEYYAIQIWRWQGRELRLTGMDFSP